MLVEEGGDGRDRIPDTLQALIARAHRPAAAPARSSCSSARSVIGRVFWGGALEHLSPELDEVDDVLETSCCATSSRARRARRSRARPRTASSTC